MTTMTPASAHGTGSPGAPGTARSRRRAAAGALALAVCSPVLSAPLLTLPAASAVSPATTGSLALVLDSSGSMAGEDPSGGSKMDAARRALGGLLAGLPDGAPVGVRAYGGQYEDQARGCSDTRQVVPLGPLDREAATAALSGLQPRGYTPIAAALRAAVGDLPTTGPRTVVLVSDGEETCGGDPCAVAGELSSAGVQLTVDTVGYGVDETARTQLSCIAEATGGTYTEAADGDALTVELARAADTGLRRYDPSGERVTGSTEALGAPVLQPGQYVDALDPAEVAYYAVDLADGVTPYLSATLVHPPGEVAGSSFDSMEVTLFGPDGKKCGSASRNTSQSYGGTASGVVARTDAVGSEWSGTFSSSSSNACGRPGRYTFSVERDEYGVGQAALPVELRVLVEPPPVDRASLPVPPVTVPAALPAPVLRTPLTPVTGGGSFTTATRLRPGSSEDTIRPGETLYFRVPLEWGQRLAYTASIPAPRPGEPGIGSANLISSVVNPARGLVTLLEGADAEDYYGGTYDDDGATVGGSTAAVQFRNRDVDEDALDSLPLAGDQYLVLQLGTTSEPTDLAVPLRIALDVTGEQVGTPTYGAATGAQDPTEVATGSEGSGSEGSGSESSGTEGSDNGGSGAEGSGDDRSGSGSADSAAGSADSGGVPWRTVGYTGGGVAALALAAALLLAPLLRGRRSRSGPFA